MFRSSIVKISIIVVSVLSSVSGLANTDMSVIDNKFDKLQAKVEKSTSEVIENADGTSYLKPNLDKVQKYVVDEKNRINYEKINSNLEIFSKEIDRRSLYLEGTHLSVESNISGPGHKFLVDYAPSVAKYGLVDFALKFGTKAAVDKPISMVSVKSIDFSFKASRGLGIVSSITASFLDTFVLNLAVGMDSLEAVKLIMGLKEIKESCKQQSIDELAEQIPEAKQALELSCLIAERLTAAKSFNAMVSETTAQIKQLVTLVDDKIKEALKRETGSDLASAVAMFYSFQALNETCEKNTLRKIKDALGFNCVPTFVFSFDSEFIIGEVDTRIVISEKSVQLLIDSNLNERALSFVDSYSDKDEMTAEFLTLFYTGMKSMEILNVNEIELVAEDIVQYIDNGIKIIDEKLSDKEGLELKTLD